MSGCRGASRTRVCVGVLLALLLAWSAPSAPRTSAAEESPYRVEELAVERGPAQQTDPVVAGRWVVWGESDTFGSPRRLRGKDLGSGQAFAVPTSGAPQLPVDVHGDTLVVTEASDGEGIGVYAYHLPDGARSVVAPPVKRTDFARGPARVFGDHVVWTEGTPRGQDVFAHNLKSGQTIKLTVEAAPREGLSISGSIVVWLDRRHGSSRQAEADVYGYDLDGRREFRITSQPERIGEPTVSGNVVVWPTLTGTSGGVRGYDLAAAVPLTIATFVSGTGMPTGLDADGDVVVWSAAGETDEDVFGYDLRLRRPFIISRAIGAQVRPRISGRTVVWTEHRHSGVGKYEGNPDVYAARLEPGPAPEPPVVGAPTAVDARIEIVWPHGGAAVADASRANVAVWLFTSGTLDLAPCQWRPRVLLWRALNNEPARIVGVGLKTAGHYFTPDHHAIPTWEFNDVDVSAARDPRNRLYFFATVEGLPSRTTVWAHAADARTYSPAQEVPAGIAESPDAVEAKIQIVWPHGGAPVERARRANVTALLLRPATSFSVPKEWDKPVRLLRAIDNGVAEPVATGERRLATGRTFSYPVWDFNDVDVSAAMDPASKVFFLLQVDGVQTHTSVWSHGADARTRFPAMDVPTAACR